MDQMEDKLSVMRYFKEDPQFPYEIRFELINYVVCTISASKSNIYKLNIDFIIAMVDFDCCFCCSHGTN